MPIGVYDEFTNSNSTNLQAVLNDLDAAVQSAGVSPFTIDTDAALGDYIRATDPSNHFILGGGTIPVSTLYFNASSSALRIGMPFNGTNGINGSLILAASQSGATSPSINSTAQGDLIIPTGKVGIGASPSGGFTLDVNGNIGPSQDAVYDLGSPTRRFRNIFLSGATTSDGDITIANVDPSLRYVDTTPGEDTFALSVDHSTYTIRNETQGRNELVISAVGDWDIAGGSGSTGCTIQNSSGNLTCTGNIQTTTGAFQANGGSITSTANNLTINANGTVTIDDNLSLTGTISDPDSNLTVNDALDVLGSTTINGGGSANAALIVNQLNGGDIIAASSGGTTRFRVTNTGQLVLRDDNLAFYGRLEATTLTQDRNYSLPNDSGTICLQNSVACGFALNSENYWRLDSNLISASNTTYDLAIGGNSTTSAKFAFINNAGGVPTASISAGSVNNYIYTSQVREISVRPTRRL